MAGGEAEIDHPGVGGITHHQRAELEPQSERFDPPVLVHRDDRVGIERRHAVSPHHLAGPGDCLVELIEKLQIGEGKDVLREHAGLVGKALDAIAEKPDHRVGIPLGEGEIRPGNREGGAGVKVTEQAVDDRLCAVETAPAHRDAELLIERFRVAWR